MSDREEGELCDEYDYFDGFDAPQFCDFAALANSSDLEDKEAQAEADRFFGIVKEDGAEEEGTEEEAFLSAEALTPSISLPNDYSIISDYSLELEDKENHSLPYATPMGKEPSPLKKVLTTVKRNILDSELITPTGSPEKPPRKIEGSPEVPKYYLRTSLMNTLEKLTQVDDEEEEEEGAMEPQMEVIEGIMKALRTDTIPNGDEQLKKDEEELPLPPPIDHDLEENEEGGLDFDDSFPEPPPEKTLVQDQEEEEEEQQFEEVKAPLPPPMSAHEERESLYIAAGPIGEQVLWGSPQVQYSKCQEGVTNKGNNSFEEPKQLELRMSPLKGRDLRRASSLNDLYKLVEPKAVKSTVFGFNPRVGITIPKTPDSRCVESRIGRCKSAVASAKSIVKRAEPAPSKLKIPIRVRPSWDLKPPVKAGGYMSMAEQISRFQASTPSRYHSAPKNQLPTLPTRSKSVEQVKKGLEKSQGPVLRTASRSRSRSASSSHSNEALPNKPKAPQCTIKPSLLPPRHFDFKKALYMPMHKGVEQPKEAVEFQFKARPAPLKIFQGPVGIKGRHLMKPTSPHSPHFEIEARLKERHEREQKKLMEAAAKQVSSPPGSARSQRSSKIPTPVSRKPSTPRSPTKIIPFSFEERDKELRRARQEKLIKELEEKDRAQRVFNARPLPSFQEVKLPPKREPHLTQIRPFKLSSDERTAMHHEMMRKKIEEEEREHAELRAFHAQEPLVLFKPAFEPIKPARLLEPPKLTLKSEERAKEREKYDKEMREKEEAEQERRREEEERKAELERAEEIARRERTDFKARPFKEPPPFKLRPSDKPLTNPQSPAFKPLPSIRRTHH